MQKKILISGFFPFDNNSINPSEMLINYLAKCEFESDRIVRNVVLPVTFDGAFATFRKHYDDFCPDVIILTGFARNRKTLTVERIGINWVNARIPDNNGVMPLSKKIDENGPDGLFTTFDVDKIIELGKSAGVEIKLSTSAGEYVCNELLYRVLCYTKTKNTQVTFIHIPELDNYDGIHLAFLSLVNSL